jgi:hypothetical protein
MQIVPILVTTACLTFVSAAGYAQQSFARGNPSATPPQALLDELSALVNKAETERAADRRFIEDLRAFIAQYDRPWSRVVLQDNFSDGNYQRSPPWTVTQGKFQVDRRYGLYSQATAASTQAGATQSGSDKGGNGRDIAAALIGSILQQALNQGANKNTQSSTTPTQTIAPRIETNIRSNNAFALKTELVGIADGTIFTVALSSNSGSETGYQLHFTAGQRANVELVRVTDYGTAVVDRRDAVIASGASAAHVFEWTRARNGNMRVSVDGRQVLSIGDRGIKSGFSRLSITHTGEIGLRQITLTSTP